MLTRWIMAGGTILLLAIASLADEWPQFRGPNGSGVSQAKHLPEQWAPHQDIRWTFKDPGFGWSSPVVWGDRVYLTTAVTDKQTKPTAGNMGFGGGFGAGNRGRRGPGGFGGPPRTGELLPGFMQYFLHLTDVQKKRVVELQKAVDKRLAEILTSEQRQQLNARPASRGFGGFGPPSPGQVLPPAQQERLKLTDDQKKDLGKLQKEVDARLPKILTDAQNKQLADMRRGFGRGGPGRGRGRGPGGFGGGGPPPNVAYRWEVYCLDAGTGHVIWKNVAAEQKPRAPKQPSNSYASETPITDGERLYVYFGNVGLYCYDLGGKLIWSKDLGSHPIMGGWGTGSSPALDGDRLFVQCDNEDRSFLVALDKKTGNELWRVGRDEKTSWSTPFVWRNNKRTEVVTCNRMVRSYDPATGKLLWELGLSNTGGMPGISGGACATPVGDRDLLYVGLGSRMGARTLFAVRAGASGDISLKTSETSNDSVAWSRKNPGPSMASPLLYRGYIYILEEHGGLIGCYDARTGKQAYRERLPQAGGFTASPWAYDSKVFCLDDSGKTFVLQSGSQYKLLATNKIAEMCWSSPAIADGSLFLRGRDDLYCIGSK